MVSQTLHTKMEKLLDEVEYIIENEDLNEVNCQHIEKEHPYYYQKQLYFLKGLHLFCKSKGLAYNYDDIVNLHISIKTNFITIFSLCQYIICNFLCLLISFR